MDTVLKVAGLQAAWWGSVGVYLCSKRQLLRRETLTKSVGWLLFTVASVASVALLGSAHDSFTAMVYWLAALMSSWTLLILAPPHLPSSVHLLSGGSILMLVAAGLG
ncbi:MAG: hypothetical protein AAFP04_13190 [Myxococcota bacterium]